MSPENATPGPEPVRYDPDCDLCKAERFTHWYHEDDVCWIADCEVCSVPMVVWKPHGTDPSDETVEHMLDALTTAATERFGPDAFNLDRNMRQIPEHWHAHARDANWFAERASRPMSRYTGVGTAREERPLPGTRAKRH
ncbi:MAG: hypothetical protein AAF567_11245 [Actinomycetota bacterium]